ncbi:DMP19 family protein [Neobacillus drentensis]|uniref:DMP19 family protein n=1 Tax=Neobacillus drentensis TaxID=220684 RepID=UPI00286B56F6|nr:hypothetical protein [Neobacillus drentensis]
MLKEKVAKLGLKGLNNNERQFYLVDCLLKGIDKGTLNFFVTSDISETFDEVLIVLKELDLSHFADLVIRANEVSQSSKSNDEKFTELEKIEDEYFELEYTEIYEKLLTLLS